MRSAIVKFAAHVAVCALCYFLVLLHRCFRYRANSTRVDPGTVVLIGTFYNPGWLHAHILPLARADSIKKVYVVCDEIVDQQVAQYAEFVCPSAKQIRWFGRSISRVLTLIKLGYKYRPALYMGYHVMPNAPLALFCARLFGGLAIYQMTGGPIQIHEGGHGSENPLLKATQTPSKSRESALFSLVRCFDTVVVRGNTAMQYVNTHRLAERCLRITGAIDVTRFKPNNETPNYDLVYVGRLVKYKGLELLIDTIEKLKQRRPNVQASIVGGGDLDEWIADEITSKGLTPHVTFQGKQEDVVPYLQQGKVFILTSPSEGMSIAMLEALACGLPAYVTNVGDLSDAVSEENGALFDQRDGDVFAESLATLLADQELLEQKSHAARTSIIEGFSIETITKRWDEHLSAFPNFSSRETSQ